MYTPKQLNKKFKLRSDKRGLFCLEYVKDLNATRAAKEAKYSVKSADVQGAQNLANVKVMECITFLQNEYAKTKEYNASDLRADLLAMKNMSIADIFDDDFNLKPLSEWSEVWLTSVSAIDVSELSKVKGKKDLLTVVKKIKFPDTVKVIELLGKHIDIQAWREVHKVENTTLAKRIERARDRRKNKKKK